MEEYRLSKKWNYSIGEYKYTIWGIKKGEKEFGLLQSGLDETVALNDAEHFHIKPEDIEDEDES